MRNTNDIERKLAAVINPPKPAPRHLKLASIQDITELTALLREEREILIARCRTGAGAFTVGSSISGLSTARDFSDLMDAVIGRMFALACHKVGADTDRLPIAIVATGGYGRRELCPYSDIDITFIPFRDGDPQIDRVIRSIFSMLMDVINTRCGLEVGYAYRLMEDCASLDHKTQTGLLDARLICGSGRLFIQFEDAFWTGFNATDFLFSKLGEREKALSRWGVLPRVVEPQLKEGPGGLRDIQTAVWLVQARRHLAAARVRGERGIAALEKADVPAMDCQRLAEAKEFLFRVRNALHAITGAERDQLVVTRQEDVATALGYGAPDSDRAVTVPVEQFMADLYTHLALVRRVAEQTFHRVRNSRLILGIGLDCKRGEIVPANEALEYDDSAWLLWAFELAQKYKLEVSDDVKSAALALVETSPILADPALSTQVFTRILSKVGRVYPALQQMSDLGILGWFLPEFGRLLDLIPYDPSHDFTVGQHSLNVIRELEGLLSADGATEELAEMRRVLLELTHPEELMLAALLHDAGKAVPGRPHDEVSEEIVATVCARLGWPETSAQNVRFLARRHLLMAETSRLRDLNLEETIRDFTQTVDDMDRLNMLYLLTYADTRAVGEGVWTQVKGRFLSELWRRAAGVLCEEEPLGYDDATVARARRRLLKDLSLENIPESEVEEHIEAMPAQYLLNQSLKRMGLHIAFIRQLRQTGQPVVEFFDERDATYTELTVCAYDEPRPGLLAKIAGVLYSAELEVHGAEVLTRVTPQDRIALDTLWVDFRGRQLSPGKRREIVTKLQSRLSGVVETGNVAPRNTRMKLGAPMPVASPLTVQAVRNDLSDTLTVVETHGGDVRSALFHVSSALAKLGWDIRSARVSAWRGEARATFYIAGMRHILEAAAVSALTEVLPATP